MAWFPIMIELGGRPCLVAGGGTTAQRKARSLLEAGALVKVVSLRFVAGFDSLDVRREARAVRPQDVQGMALVVDATGDPETARQLRAACRSAGIPFNCAAHPEKEDAAFPAILRRGSLVAGISTSGASPAAAAWVRDRLDDAIPDTFEEILTQMENLRQRAKQRFPEQRQRAAFLHACLDAALEKGAPLTAAETDEMERTVR
ncbi:bifunctional precorrin-2 dehydrogenase/sirohydrochlorin ferrochelatase [Subdoligranulum sp. DSM 109015]|uniref:precorrin-2 dehydrogenase n=1 Tax=Gemmiger gallinarum TaxID=2779354 RepID=A0ABR9R0R2_9FIRM|nr:bifunctional precorrin-2 dehydrogenase/sirohydrochlorin ferrochelatase [Gemmiger gallinarum]MBE5036723.1 bifunctional precorrin-2 dehydrogenase/sirohydrochlorin ferrochelatase [Gemmiger gallinarum]